jgi:hypothetical protein
VYLVALRAVFRYGGPAGSTPAIPGVTGGPSRPARCLNLGALLLGQPGTGAAYQVIDAGQAKPARMLEGEQAGDTADGAAD